MLLFAVKSVIAFQCVYINMDDRHDRNTHMRAMLHAHTFECTRVSPIVINQTRADALWPSSWTFGTQKKGIVSLHQTLLHILRTVNDTVLVLEDDVVLGKEIMHPRQFLAHLATHPSDHILRFDCFGNKQSKMPNTTSCGRRNPFDFKDKRMCWCGGTHAVLHPLAFRRQTIAFYESHVDDIDCSLINHPHAVCINRRIVSRIKSHSNIPKTVHHWR